MRAGWDGGRHADGFPTEQQFVQLMQRIQVVMVNNGGLVTVQQAAHHSPSAIRVSIKGCFIHILRLTKGRPIYIQMTIGNVKLHYLPAAQGGTQRRRVAHH